MRTRVCLAAGTALLMLAVSPSALAAVTIGDPGGPPGNPVTCPGPLALFQPSVSTGPDYRVPPDGGVITSWATQAGNIAAPHAVALLLADQIGGGVRVIHRSDTQNLTPSALNSFKVRIPVSGGERLGLLVPTGSMAACRYQLSATSLNQYMERAVEPILNVVEGPYTTSSSNKVAISAVVERDKDGDKFGDDSQDSCPIDASIQVPCAARVESGPRKKTKSRKATIAFSVPAGDGITFECALDQAEFSACTNPVALKGLKRRKHAFRVRARNAGGQTGPETIIRWRVTKR